VVPAKGELAPALWTEPTPEAGAFKIL
jgi:hypothetical protein